MDYALSRFAPSPKGGDATGGLAKPVPLVVLAWNTPVSGAVLVV